MTLKFLNSKAPSHYTPAQTKTLDYLRKMEDGEILTLPYLAVELGMSFHHISREAAHCPEIYKHRAKVKGAYWYGNLKTAAEARKQYPQHDIE